MRLLLPLLLLIFLFLVRVESKIQSNKDGKVEENNSGSRARRHLKKEDYPIDNPDYIARERINPDFPVDNPDPSEEQNTKYYQNGSGPRYRRYAVDMDEYPTDNPDDNSDYDKLQHINPSFPVDNSDPSEERDIIYNRIGQRTPDGWYGRHKHHYK